MRKLKVLVLGLFAAFSGLLFAPQIIDTTVSGQSGLGIPSGVSASDGDYATKIGVNWNAVRGATSYQIFRNTTNDSGGAIMVGTTAAPFFFDVTAIVGQQYFFWVKAANGSDTGSFSLADTGVRANGVQQGPVPPLEPPPVPAGNQITASKAVLGKILFWDEQLSSTLTVSCGTCHRPSNGGSDPRSITGNASARNPGVDLAFDTPDDVVASPGVPLNDRSGLYNWSPTYGLLPQVTSRKSPSYINAGYSPLLFWDGRATGTYRDPITNAIVLNNGAALETQSAGPPLSDAEMAHTGRNWFEAAAQIADSRPLALSPSVPASISDWIGGRNYSELFAEAFGTPEVTPARISLAIGTFERTLFSDRTPLDLANAGITPLSAAEQRGHNTFVNIQCNVCHGGNLLTDNAFHNIGLRPQNEDPGRFGVTGNINDLGEFRTPGLRNVELRAPYMHNGRLATLEEVVEFYNRGGDFPQAPNFPNNLIRPRNLTEQQKADLVAFLRRPLTDVRVANETGPFDRPTLYTESNRVPIIQGQGTNGSGGRLPQAIAIEPPIAGNPSFTVAVANALGGANAVLVIGESDPGNTSAIPPFGSFVRRAVQLGGSGAGAGFGSVSLEIPDTTFYVGKTLFGRWYISDAGAANGVAVSQAFRFTIFGTAATSTAFDYDGDGRADVSVRRPSDNIWYLLQGDAGYTAITWGEPADRMAPADYDGDGKTDVAVFRPSNGIWYVVNSTTSTFTTYGWGQSGDLPVPTDRDNDGRADLVVYRESNNTWYTRSATTGPISTTVFGAAGDKPVRGDFDADGRGDNAVFRPSTNTWYIQKSTAGFYALTWGETGDIPTPADFDGDGATDLAVFRPSTGQWFVSRSTAGFIVVNWGQIGDVPIPADYDGDGKADPAIFRPAEGRWYLNQSSAGFLNLAFGQSGDVPTQSAFIF